MDWTSFFQVANRNQVIHCRTYPLVGFIKVCRNWDMKKYLIGLAAVLVLLAFSYFAFLAREK